MKERAEALLDWAHEKNPGPWANHSRVAARAAKKIAEACGLDAKRAYISGLLHDIGRYEGVTDMRHAYAGYELLINEDLGEFAGVCLTHSFQFKNIGSHSGKNDCGPEETEFIKKYLAENEYDNFDRLIQLCDSICAADGVCLIETRLTDVTRRYGFNEFTLKKWDATFGLKKYFDKLCGKNIYGLFIDEITERLVKYE